MSILAYLCVGILLILMLWILVSFAVKKWQVSFDAQCSNCFAMPDDTCDRKTGYLFHRVKTSKQEQMYLFTESRSFQSLRYVEQQQQQNLNESFFPPLAAIDVSRWLFVSLEAEIHSVMA